MITVMPDNASLSLTQRTTYLCFTSMDYTPKTVNDSILLAWQNNKRQLYAVCPPGSDFTLGKCLVTRRALNLIVRGVGWGKIDEAALERALFEARSYCLQNNVKKLAVVLPREGIDKLDYPRLHRLLERYLTLTNTEIVEYAALKTAGAERGCQYVYA